MSRWFRVITGRVPNSAQMPLVGGGLVLAAVGGARVAAHEPPEHAFEPFVGFPIFALVVFWFGLGLFALGLALTNDARVGTVALFRFSDAQRSGLMASAILLVSPLVFGIAGLVLRPFFAIAFLSAFFALGATVGVVATFVWRSGELLWAVGPFGTPE